MTAKWHPADDYDRLATSDVTLDEEEAARFRNVISGKRWTTDVHPLRFVHSDPPAQSVGDPNTNHTGDE